MTRLTQSVAMGVGTDGAMVDVSAYADLDAGVSRSWGRRGEFDDAAPGTFSFTLDNADGRFTPEHPNSPLATTVTEGMSVCWQLGSRLVAGTIQAIEPSFPSGQSAWAQVRITCDDMLGNAGRRGLHGSLIDSTLESGVPYLLWPLDEETGAAQFAESVSSGPVMLPDVSGVTAGSTASQIPVSRVVALDSSVAAGITSRSPFPAVDYGSETVGAIGFWVERTSLSAKWIVGWSVAGLAQQIAVRGGAFGVDSITLQAGSFGNIVNLSGGPTMEADTPYFVAVSTSTSFAAGVWTIAATLYIDGVSQGTSTYGEGSSVTVLTSEKRQLTRVTASGLTSSTGTLYFSRISHTRNAINESYVRESTADVRLLALANVVPEITLDTPPAMSDTVLALNDLSGQSALDALSDVIRGEQGAIYTATTGTLTAPVQKVMSRGRDRVETVDCTFNAETEASGATELVRDLTNLVSMVTANGPDQSATFRDDALFARAGSANTSETIPLRDYIDLYGWASDRVWRGANEELRIAALTIDAFTTPTDRTADLLALVPGDRIQVTGLPSAQLGFSTLDGWLLGADEEQTLTSHKFILYLQPALPNTAIFDTNRYMADGCLSLSAAITSAGATTMSVSTTGAKLETSDVPYDVMVDAEQVTVTACTGASPQVATITRGVNGTTATTHTTSAVIEVAVPSLFAF